MNSSPSSPIIFFDGVCHLCNGFVDFLIQNDRHKKLKFAPLQGPTAERELSSDLRKSLATVIVKTPTQVLEKSDAVLYALSELGGVYKALSLFKAIPSPLRNGIYDWVAKNRYAWFGERETCRLPLSSEKEQLLP